MSTASWLLDGYPETLEEAHIERTLTDELDTATAEDILGRFACGLCADNRDAAERAEADIRRIRAELGRAHALLRLILRTEMRPAKREADSETPHDLALIWFAATLAAVKARIEIYFQAAKL